MQQTSEHIEWRCTGQQRGQQCGLLLGRFFVAPVGVIKCRRCGHINVRNVRKAAVATADKQEARTA